MKARDNPFHTGRILRIRYHLSGVTWEQLLQRLAALRFRAALVGPKGAGKTTLLEDLEPKLAALGFRAKRLRRDEATPAFSPAFLRDFFAELDPRDVILFDGAEQMSWWDWRRFRARSQQAGGLIVTTHRAGRLPTLLECGTTPELLHEIVGQLIGEEAKPLRKVTEELFRKHEGNLREALRELYDRYAERAASVRSADL